MSITHETATRPAPSGPAALRVPAPTPLGVRGDPIDLTPQPLEESTESAQPDRATRRRDRKVGAAVAAIAIGVCGIATAVVFGGGTGDCRTALDGMVAGVLSGEVRAMKTPAECGGTSPAEVYGLWLEAMNTALAQEIARVPSVG